MVFSVPEARWASAATVLFVMGALAHLAGVPAWLYWSIYLACYVTGGWEPLIAGIQALQEKTLDVDLLMIVAAIAAAAIGQVFDGALLIVIFATSGALEAVATKRTTDSVRALLTLAPERAALVGGDGVEEVVEAAALMPGDLIVVRPGERIGGDGTVVRGQSEVDQATITGEPLPVAKGEGDEVFAGTLNGTGTVTIRVDKHPAQSVVARIVAMVEEASATKARTQLFIDKIEQRYSVGVVVSTLLLLAVPLMLFDAQFQPTLLRAMTFMIVASPCAVVLATMPPLLAAMANAGRHGVLVTAGAAVPLRPVGTCRTTGPAGGSALMAMIQQILNAPTWVVLLVAGGVVLAEDALFVGFVLPGETAAILAGVAARLGHAPLLAVVATVVAAAVIGDSIGYEVGRRVGPRVLRWPVLQRRRARIDDAQDLLVRRGGAAVFLGRWVAFFRAVMPALAGTARMPYRRFVVWNAAGGLVWGVAVVVAGYLAGASYAKVESGMGRGAAVAVGTVAITLLATHATGTRRHHRPRE
ncbi:HAD-IC family P-type ATPase [Janibacter sp. UYMM211]|uniref:HAD-IC family P-type ATPase n=1 Tax=Janibacter sp. UYMM211 TaxID=3156342 RepID=UPI003393A957